MKPEQSVFSTGLPLGMEKIRERGQGYRVVEMPRRWRLQSCLIAITETCLALLRNETVASHIVAEDAPGVRKLHANSKPNCGHYNSRVAHEFSDRV